VQNIMFRKQPSKPQNRIDSLIGAGTKIEGNVSFSGGLRVDGEVIGNVTAVSDQPSHRIGRTGADRGKSAPHLVVNGEIAGRSGRRVPRTGRVAVQRDIHTIRWR
jgi:cytoskeletal protein CcmA (bactofilin family)